MIEAARPAARLLRAALIVAAASSALLAPAGVPLVTPQGAVYRWDLDETGAANVQGGRVTFYIDPAGPEHFTQGDRTHAEARRAGIRSWEVPTTAIRFTEAPGRPAGGRNATDRVNYVGFADGGLAPFTFAVTYSTESGTRLTDSDVILNTSDFFWSSSTPGVDGTADVESITAHEWGHAIGADHVPLRGSTMYFQTQEGAISLRSLSDDDRALIGSLYPNTQFAQTTGSIAGNVTHFAPQDDRAIHVIAISVATLLPAASALTGPTGDFRIDGLPQGEYRLLAAPTVPLNPAMNEYWLSGVTTFIPSWLRTSAANPADLTPLSVSPGQVTDAPAFSVRQESKPLEPNDSPASATPLVLGQGVCARLENGGDFDVYAFDGAAGQVVTAAVYAFGIGSAADPGLTLLRQSGQIVASSADVRAESTSRNSVEGTDLDARVVAVTLPADDTYLLRVSRQNGGNEADSFYALSLTVASDAPSSALTKVTATPDRADADGTSQIVLRVRPLRETGEDVGAGADVRFTNSGAGAVGAVTDVGDGTYEARLTTSTEPGLDRVSVRIETAAGVATLSDAVFVVYLGPASAERSTLTASPRRIDANGVAQTTLEFVPRDGAGEAFGPGRTVRFAATGTAGSVLSPVVDLLGSYASTLRAAPSPGGVDVTATVDGVPAGLTLRVPFGFDLLEVLTQADLDVDASLVSPGLKSKFKRLVRSAGTQTARALPYAQAGPGALGERKALAHARRACQKFAAATRPAKGAAPDLGTAGELARAVRDAARAATDRALIASGRDQKRVDKARARLVKGQTAYDDGKLKRAARIWLTAFGLVRKLAP